MASDAANMAKSASREADALVLAGDHTEAKRALATAVRELRELKRQISEQQRQIRAEATAARQRNAQSGQVIGQFMSSKARGAMARGRASTGRSITAKQAKLMQPLDAQKAEIDGLIAGLDRQKARITDHAARAKAAPAVRGSDPAAAVPVAAAVVAPEPSPGPTAPPPPPPHWAADPTGRHQHRFWDGTRWTEHAATNGVTYSDPL